MSLDVGGGGGGGGVGATTCTKTYVATEDLKALLSHYKKKTRSRNTKKGKKSCVWIKIIGLSLQIEITWKIEVK